MTRSPQPAGPGQSGVLIRPMGPRDAGQANAGACWRGARQGEGMW